MPGAQGVPIGASLLTRFDLSDEENVRQAEFELRRCVTDFDYARWARLWGASAVQNAAEMTPRKDWVDPTELRRKCEAEVQGAWEDARADLAGDVRVAIRKVRAAISSPAAGGDLTAVEKSLDALEGAL